MPHRSNALRRIAGTVLAAALVLAPVGVAQAQVATKRIYGATRYDTMRHIVSEGFAKSAWAVVATGDNFPDALCASALAGVSGGPVILTSGTSLSPQAQAKLTDLGVSHVYLMGGTAAISHDVESEIAAMGITCERIAGASRQDTSLQAMQQVRNGGSVSDTVIVATGQGFADTLSIGPYSFSSESPIVLTGANGLLPDATVKAIKADARTKHILIVGGTNAVSDSVKDQLGGTYTYERLGAADRYETSSKIATWSVAHGLKWSTPAIATGQNFPDALAGAALCGNFQSPLVLVSTSSGAARTLITAHAGEISQLYVLGGEASVSNDLVASVTGAQATPAPQPATPQTPVQPGSLAAATSGWYSAWSGTSQAGEQVLYAESLDGTRAVLVIYDPKSNAYLAYAGAASNPSQSIVSITDDTTKETFSYEMLQVDDKVNMSVSLGSETADLKKVNIAEVTNAVATIEAKGTRVM